MSGYRPPSTEPRGKWARAIHAKRRAEGISQTGGFELLGERLGLGPKSRSAYIAIDLGLRQPTEAEAVVLADWLGAYPSDDMGSAGSDDTSNPADLASAIRALVEELRASRLERDDLAERVGALETAAKLQARPGVEGVGAPPAPPVNAR